MSKSTLATYIWTDGTKPTAKLRSKTKILRGDFNPTDPEDFPVWSYDGSSTSQAEGAASDCILKPVCFVSDPVRGQGAFLVLCEVFLDLACEKPHPTNTRAGLRAALDAGAAGHYPWIAFEQEYTLFLGSRPLGFDDRRRHPPAQGPYYCGVGADEVDGRELVEKHLDACLKADLCLTGINAEVMPGQWEFQCGGPMIDPLKASDHLWLARWLLYRLGEGFGITATLDAKPAPGDWNGAGLHTNFSTAEMRMTEPEHEDDEIVGMEAIQIACKKIGQRIDEHLAVYGNGYQLRLTGSHETCRYDEFRWGVADRTASIRIPLMVAEDGCGYLEDRRPNANADPYEVSAVILTTTCL